VPRETACTARIWSLNKADYHAWLRRAGYADRHRPHGRRGPLWALPIGSVNARRCFGSDRWTTGLDADECSSKIRLIGSSATAAAKSADTSRFCRRIVVQRRLRAPPRHGDQIVHISGREERIGARGYPLCHRLAAARGSSQSDGHHPAHGHHPACRGTPPTR
jgi:hypothetical protein